MNKARRSRAIAAWDYVTERRLKAETKQPDMVFKRQKDAFILQCKLIKLYYTNLFIQTAKAVPRTFIRLKKWVMRDPVPFTVTKQKTSSRGYYHV